MAGFAKVTIVGTLVRDPELKYTTNQKAVCEITVAVSKGNKGNEKTAFIDCVLFNKAAELTSEYYRKGSPIGLDGELVQDNWEDRQTGQKRSKMKVQASGLHFLPRSGKRSNRSDSDDEPKPRNDDLDSDFSNNDGEVPF